MLIHKVVLWLKIRIKIYVICANNKFNQEKMLFNNIIWLKNVKKMKEIIDLNSNLL